MAKKKKWTTVNIDEFFLDQGVAQYGPPAPARLQQRGMSGPIKQKETPNLVGKVKIPKPGPNLPKGTQPRKSKKRQKGTALRTIQNEADFNPIVLKRSKKSNKLNLIKSLPDRLQLARSVGDREEEVRILRLMRNIDDLKKARRKPNVSENLIRDLEERVARDIALDPQRPIARSAIDSVFNLELNMYDPRNARWSAFIPDEYTQERINLGSSKRLSAHRPQNITFKPVTKAEKRESKKLAKRMQRIFDDDINFRKSYERLEDLSSSTKKSLRVPPMLQGMEELGLPLINNQRLQGDKQATNALEVSIRGNAFEPDELTASRVASGETRVLGELNVRLPYTAMPVEPFDPSDQFFTKEQRMNKYIWRNLMKKEAAKVRREQMIKMYEDEKLFKMSYQNLDPGSFTVGRLLPPMLQGSDFDIPKFPESTIQFFNPRIEQYKAIAARQQAQISANALSGAQDVVPSILPRQGSRIAERLGEDTVRAASVIHSSKMGRAAVGVGAMAAVFGFTSALNQRRNFEQEIQNRV